MDSRLKIIGKIETREKVGSRRFHVPKILGGNPGQHDRLALANDSELSTGCV